MDVPEQDQRSSQNPYLNIFGYYDDISTQDNSDADVRVLRDISYPRTHNLQRSQSSSEVVVELKENLVHALDRLVGQNVFMHVLKVIKRHHIEKLLKDVDMGTQILFEHHLEEWRISIGMPFNDSVQNFNLLNLSNQSLLSPTLSTCSTISNHSKFTPYSRPSTPDESSSITLSNVLNDNAKGNMLAVYYDTNKKFQDEQMASLVNLISQYFEEKGVSMSLGTSYRLEKEIIERFPSEKLEYYRTKKRGKIYNKCTNLKSSFSKVVNKNAPKKPIVKEKPTRHEQEFCPETDAETCLRAIKFDNITSEQFDNYWKACSQYRLNDIKTAQNSLEILVKWPFYKYPSGYRLVDMDFQVAFKNGDALMKKWEPDFEKIVSFLISDGHIKDKSVKCLLDKIKDEKLTENGQYVILLLALHGYLVPTNKAVKKDVSGKTNIIKYTIKDSQESFLYSATSQQLIEEHLRYLNSRKTAIQPFILSVGEDIFNPTDISVYFDGVRYSFFHILRAVDICFKIIYLFDLDFPSQSEMFWTFIEYHFFQIKARHSFSKVCILSEALKENQENYEATGSVTKI